MEALIEVLAIALIVLAGIAYFETRRTRVEGSIIYLFPSKRLYRFVHELSGVFDWRFFGDIALAVALGPLAVRYVRNRRSYIVFLLVAPFLAHSPPSLLSYIFLGLSGLALYYLAASAGTILWGYLTGEHPSPGVGLALPGLSVGPLRIPLVEGIIALAIALLVHEGAHGFVSLRNRIPVDRAGFILLGFLPIGAFVDPKERAFERAPPSARLQVLAAGPVANVVVALLFTLLLILASPIASAVLDYECTHGVGARLLSIPPTISVNGKEIKSPAYGVLQPGDVVIFVENNRVTCATQLLELLKPYREQEKNVALNLVILRENQRIPVSVTLNKGYLGVQGIETYLPSPPLWYLLAAFLLSLLSWIAFLNLMIGVVNALPLPPLDGGHMYRIIVPKAGRALFALSLLLLLINVIPWFL